MTRSGSTPSLGRIGSPSPHERLACSFADDPGAARPNVDPALIVTRAAEPFPYFRRSRLDVLGVGQRSCGHAVTVEPDVASGARSSVSKHS